MSKQYKILYLCADLLDFDGSRGDMLYFLSRLKAYDVDYVYVAHQLGESINVTDFDFVYAGVCPQKYEALYLTHLQEDIKGLDTYVMSGKPMLAIEQSFLFLGQELTNAEKTIHLLGILPLTITQLDHYAIGNILWQSNIVDFDSKVNGFINTRYNFDFGQAAGLEPLGTICLGVDFLWERKFEGVRYKNFFGTQLRGPILPRNYDFADYLIKLMLQTTELPAIDSTIEQQAKEKLTADSEAFIASGEQKKEYIYVS